MTRENAKVPVYDAEHIEKEQEPRIGADGSLILALAAVVIVALFVAVLVIVGRVV
jgi:hypothetical protein